MSEFLGGRRSGKTIRSFYAMLSSGKQSCIHVSPTHARARYCMETFIYFLDKTESIPEEQILIDKGSMTVTISGVYNYKFTHIPKDNTFTVVDDVNECYDFVTLTPTK